MRLTTDTLARRLEQGLLPVYLVSGDEPLLVAEAADAVRARARAEGFTEREVVVLDRGTDWEAVRAAVATLSLFAQRRIVELRLATGKAGVTGGRVLATAIESAGADTLLVVLTGRLDRDAQSADWVRAAEARGAWIVVSPVTRAALVPWLRERCRRLELTADDDALEALAEHTQGNLLAAHQELEKLKLLGAAERITVEKMLAVVTDSARFHVGELSEALTRGSLERALRVLGGLEAEGAELPLVLWAVTRAMRELWGARRRGLPFERLAARALRADGLAKGRIVGDAWSELALLACEICGRPALPLPASRIQ